MQENKSGQVQWPMILIVLLLSLIILTFLYWNVISVQGNMIKQAEASYMQQQIHDLEASLTEIEQECQSLNHDISRNPLIEQSITKAKRQSLTDLELPAYSRWQNKYSLNNLQLISPQGLVLWSVDESKNQGEDVGYKRVIQASLREKERLVALEFADAGMNIMSTVPLFTEDKFIGVCELDMSMEKALEKKLVKTVRVHYAIFQLDGIHRSLIWEDKKSQVVLNTSDLKKIHQGEAFYRPTQDPRIMLGIVPLKDIDGIPIGYIQVEISRQAFQDARTNNWIFLLIITLLMMITSIFMVSRAGINFPQSKHEMANLVDSGKISRISVNVKPVLKNNSEDEKL